MSIYIKFYGILLFFITLAQYIFADESKVGLIKKGNHKFIMPIFVRKRIK